MRLGVIAGAAGALLLGGCEGAADARQARAIPSADAGCEGCEAALERDPASLSPVARLTAADEPGQPLLIQGVVRQADGRTPAGGVVVYAYHTNAEGRYADGGGETEWSRRHGRLRAWVRTGPDGRYAFQTVKPGVYPDRSGPAHVHLTVWEQGRAPYWVDSIVFQGEFGVTPDYLARRTNQGGPGAIRLQTRPDGVLLARRDIVLPPVPKA